MFLVLLLGFASALECNVPHKEGHYHMTSVKSKNKVAECRFDLSDGMTYIEFERYTGMDMDKNAWMNFTFEGKPDVEVSVGQNKIIVNEQLKVVSTMTKLEFSMWFMVKVMPEQVVIHFSPPGNNINFGHVFKGRHLSAGQLRVVTSTSTGMEQIILHVSNTPPKISRMVKRKTIHELERRIRELEQVVNIDVKNSDRHMRQTVFKRVQHLNANQEKLNVKQQDLQHNMTEYVDSMVYYCIVLVIFLYVSNLTGGYIYWKMSKKNSRWSL